TGSWTNPLSQRLTLATPTSIKSAKACWLIPSAVRRAMISDEVNKQWLRRYLSTVCWRNSSACPDPRVCQPQHLHTETWVFTSSFSPRNSWRTLDSRMSNSSLLHLKQIIYFLAGHNGFQQED